MTYCSRNSKISLGLGSSGRPSSVASASSSSMISLQRSMHSSQMYTPGPAMSFLTCFCDLPQNEHFSSSPLSPNFATRSSPVSQSADRAGAVDRQARRDHVVDDAIRESLVRLHHEIAVGVGVDPLDRLPRVVGEDLLQQV